MEHKLTSKRIAFSLVAIKSLLQLKDENIISGNISLKDQVAFVTSVEGSTYMVNAEEVEEHY